MPSSSLSISTSRPQRDLDYYCTKRIEVPDASAFPDQRVVVKAFVGNEIGMDVFGDHLRALGIRSGV